MPEFLVVHLGAYPTEQLREEHGLPAAQAIIINAKDASAAIQNAAPVFAEFSPVGRCIALPFKNSTELIADPTPDISFVEPE